MQRVTLHVTLIKIINIVIVSFKSKALKNFFINGDSSKLNPNNLLKLRLVLAKLDAAESIRDMNFPGSKLHQLVGDYKDFWSITISSSWRIIFQFKNGKASMVDYLDYH